jgi:hypothetical protein
MRDSRGLTFWVIQKVKRFEPPRPCLRGSRTLFVGVDVIHEGLQVVAVSQS